jgi:hypothetical protein
MCSIGSQDGALRIGYYGRCASIANHMHINQKELLGTIFYYPLHQMKLAI